MTLTRAGENHIHFQCDMIRYFEPTLARVMIDHPGMTREDAEDLLCNDWEYGKSIGWHESSALHTWDAPYQYLTDYYDTKSIMHYDSSAFSDPLICNQTTPDRCPLSTIDGNYIETNTAPSPGDVHAIRFLYPWKP